MKQGYKVIWCKYIPETDSGDMDVDNAEYEERRFKTKTQAVKFAETVTDKYYGEPFIKSFEIIQYNDGFPGSYVKHGEAEEW